MRIAYFYYDEWPDASEVLPGDARRIYTGPGTSDYWNTFAGEWGSGHDLVTIEQDVAIHPDVIPQFRACPEPWCSFPYQVGPGQECFWWLGCTRFSSALQEAVPVADLCRPNPPDVCAACSDVPCHRHLDVVLQAVMEYLGYEHPHVHTPAIRHLRVPDQP